MNAFESALRIAREAATRSETWLDFQRILFGTNGLLTAHFVDEEMLEEFLQTRAFRDLSRAVAYRPLGVSVPGQITLTEQLERRLSAESDLCGLTIEQLCLAKLAALVADCEVSGRGTIGGSVRPGRAASAASRSSPRPFAEPTQRTAGMR